MAALRETAESAPFMHRNGYYAVELPFFCLFRELGRRQLVVLLRLGNCVANLRLNGAHVCFS